MSTASTAPSTSIEMTFNPLVAAAAATVDDTDPQEARRIARGFNETHPEESAAWCLHGAATQKAGDPLAAIPLLAELGADGE